MAESWQDKLDMTSHSPPIYLLRMIHFFDGLPKKFFTIEEDGVLRHDGQFITVCNMGKGKLAPLFPDRLGGVLKVTTENELSSLTNKLLRLPILLGAEINVYQPEDHNLDIKLDFAVCVNPLTECLQTYMGDLLTQAMDCMRRGRYFALEFNFNPIINSWVKEYLRPTGRDVDSSRIWSRNAMITVTNFSEHSHLFCCRDEAAYAVWGFTFCVLLPAWPIYKIQRAIRVTDLGGEVRGDEIWPTFLKPSGESLLLSNPKAGQGGVWDRLRRRWDHRFERS